VSDRCDNFSFWSGFFFATGLSTLALDGIAMWTHAINGTVCLTLFAILAYLVSFVLWREKDGQQ